VRSSVRAARGDGLRYAAACESKPETNRQVSSASSQNKPKKRQKRRKPASGKDGRGNESPLEAASNSKFYGLLFAVFLVVAFAAYEPALDGEFISDDMHYVATNVYVQNPSLANVMAILDPTGMPAKLVENYAPVHLFLHSIEWQLFGRNVYGYHVVNVALHAVVSLLLAMMFQACGFSRRVAALGAAFFLLHPANVEAVAWISQIKTTSALMLLLLALMAHFKRPALGAILFTLALFAKPTAAVGLFALATGGAMRGMRDESDSETDLISRADWNWRWIAIWCGILIAFAVAEFWAFNKTAGQAPVFYVELDTRLRTLCTIALRYLVMAFSGFGVSTFHEPPPAATWVDARWLASLVVLALLAWRTLVVIRLARIEAIFWVCAVVSFAPISGVIPLPFPMADRYLYFILPGLIGGFTLLCRDAWAVTSKHFGPAIPARVASAIAIVLAVLWLGFFYTQSHKRAGIWKNGFTMMADAEKNYPEGLAAQTRIAKRRALAGDAEGTVRALRAAYARGYNRLDHIITDPGYDRVRRDPVFAELVREIALDWIERYEQIEEPQQAEYRLMAQAYIVLDDLDAAIRNIESGLKVEGPFTEALRDDREALLRKKRIRESVRPGL
jgi:hypothetical protein